MRWDISFFAFQTISRQCRTGHWNAASLGIKVSFLCERIAIKTLCVSLVHREAIRRIRPRWDGSRKRSQTGKCIVLLLFDVRRLGA